MEVDRLKKLTPYLNDLDVHLPISWSNDIDEVERARKRRE